MTESLENRIEKIKDKLERSISRARYGHTLGVMYMSAALAMRYGENIEYAMLAGLLHDCAKDIPTGEKLALCEKYGLDVSESERNNPELLHAKLGAEIARDEYGTDDEYILSAIRCHTTGKPSMTLLDKIVYAADYIEPYRDAAGDLDAARRLAFTDLDRCLLVILESTLKYLRSKKTAADPVTERAYMFYRNRSQS